MSMGIKLTPSRSEVNKQLGEPAPGMSWVPTDPKTMKLPHGQFAVLMNLYSYDDNESRSLADISAEVGMSRQRVSVCLKALEKKGFLTLDTELPADVSRTRRKMSATKMLSVFARNDYQCVQCGSRDNLTVDHIVPWSKGGTNEMNNLQTLCRSCNSSKGTKDFGEWEEWRGERAEQ